MKSEKYKQCELVQYDVEHGKIVTKKLVTYIPSRYATLGKELYVEDCSGVWTVTWVSAFEIDMLPDVHSEIRKHRKNTGDSLPK